MKKTVQLCGIAVLGTIVAGFLGSTLRNDVANSVRAADANAATAPEPVEDDMHEFMEYVFQPTYRRLKAEMAEQPADNQAWKAIKSDSLILAEGGNLLLIRTPDEKADSWNEHSAAVRELAGELYASAKAKDYAAAREHYTTMLQKCNSCHNDFADGEHQLKP